jgi:plastocyanin domain-containing protein
MIATYFLIELAAVLAGLAVLWSVHHTSRVREIDIDVDAGYSPNTVVVRRDEALRLRLFRANDRECTREIVFPSLGIRKTLPVGRPVTIDLRPRDAGSIEFFCGMKMLRGALEVRPQI